MNEILRPEPYVGISGIATGEQHMAIIDIATDKQIRDLGYFVMIGVQATGKTQVLEVENKRGRMWHPVGDELITAALNDPSEVTKPFVHCYFEDHELEIGTKNVMRRARNYVRGIQFNGLRWMETDYQPFFDRFKLTYPGQDIILQANEAILRQCSASEVAKKLAKLSVDYVLFDPSSGYGIQMELAKIRPYVDEVYQRQLTMRTGVAGGLDSENLQNIYLPLRQEYPGLCSDTERRMRKGRQPGKTVLDLKKVKKYLTSWRDAESLA